MFIKFNISSIELGESRDDGALYFRSATKLTEKPSPCITITVTGLTDGSLRVLVEGWSGGFWGEGMLHLFRVGIDVAVLGSHHAERILRYAVFLHEECALRLKLWKTYKQTIWW